MRVLLGFNPKLPPIETLFTGFKVSCSEVPGLGIQACIMKVGIPQRLSALVADHVLVQVILRQALAPGAGLARLGPGDDDFALRLEIRDPTYRR
ncbi:hypothetical protein D3C77_226830 [compost metagenome]